MWDSLPKMCAAKKGINSETCRQGLYKLASKHADKAANDKQVPLWMQLLVEELEAKLKAVQLEKARLEVQNSQLESALVARMKLASHPNGNRVMAIDKVQL